MRYRGDEVGEEASFEAAPHLGQGRLPLPGVIDTLEAVVVEAEAEMQGQLQVLVGGIIGGRRTADGAGSSPQTLAQALRHRTSRAGQSWWHGSILPVAVPRETPSAA